ncbi:MAG: ammonia-forming cytochrome c nitrite reductase subunit c552 [Candidatus Eisenbacteria bacterium]|uniref:Ammonia-forming cytochrome c nitrite reductase subunit c552 n=1 Tax=Eiseniibacteriota bacterium TaxID=2212470 RepID=A0A956LZE4_UNCEI|nr:ammonia-forming cytochrome c nitrite reductase subunit c552 [Candidatus Eisenbacteria bacterium]
MSFRAIFIAVLVSASLIAAALILNARRPRVETAQPTAALVKASGKCAECHRRETEAMVVEFERSRHAAQGVNCLDCHQPVEGQEGQEHRGFTIATKLTAKNCAQCHHEQYQQFLRSRHAAPAYAAVLGSAPFTAQQISASEEYHPGAVERAANPLVGLEGDAAAVKGCLSCHSIGTPNTDGSIGSCTQCHARHLASVRLARLPETCGQCHMGPDHSQLEIYTESKHGVLFNDQRERMNLDADPNRLTAADMPVPTCATCHLSGLGGQRVTHDTSERLSYWLFAAVSDRRPGYLEAQNRMKDICNTCHVQAHTDRFYAQAESVVVATNAKIEAGMGIMKGLYDDGLLTRQPFDEPIEFTAFDFWHYYGRTAKHGAFMGGADFVQWHGNYELLLHQVELQAEADDLRSRRAGH